MELKPGEDEILNLEYVLKVEPRLRPVVELVTALCVLVHPEDVMCYACVWDDIVKPITSPLLGWERVPANTATDAWLSSSEAYDLFSCAMLGLLEDADPGNGHGIGRGEEKE